ncbi:YbaK/aminoacyl-tRNA synthetase-associated domain-containing protein [Jimgerdemannia flammicorona]|uniref:YbaK/aminoacyl-tRNA synthetase-associated domain-containing protein n=1 Tax=Jimgerdemannia flammicorona TaxID=994334 RepID=A0A433Q7Q9_9FUNG|nr:YbaK/aminoacyl-tRNA synthetase-associated domain-containing protein [Jimgerdemannia flammicorona]
MACQISQASDSSLPRKRIYARAWCSRIPGARTMNPLNSKYYCVIVQYVASINTQKLMNYVRALNNNLISRKNYNMRLTSPENSLALTGFDYGGVSPIGMKQPVPVILSEAIVELQPPVFFLGAGHVDWKIAMPIDDFLKATKCFMADLS